MKAELKKLKVYKGLSHDSTAFNAELWIDGKLAAYCENDGHGGDNFIQYVDRMHGKSAFEAAFAEWTGAMPPMPIEDEFLEGRGMEPIPMDDELWVGLEVERLEEERFWKRRCSKTMCVILKTHKPGQFTQYKAWPYSPDAAQELRRKHGDDLVEIINERFLK